MTLELVPITQQDARRFIYEHHRHNRPATIWKFGVGVAVENELVGVAMAGLPKARLLMDGRTLEIMRTCTDGTKNANSMLYGAVARAAKALGWKKLITYTLESEPGTSLKAAGWTKAAYVEDGNWTRPNQPPNHAVIPSEQQPDLFGMVKMRPTENKIRWEKDL